MFFKGVELTDENWLEKTVVPSELRKKVLHQARFKALTSIQFFQVKNKAYIHTLTESKYVWVRFRYFPKTFATIVNYPNNYELPKLGSKIRDS